MLRLARGIALSLKRESRFLSKAVYVLVYTLFLYTYGIAVMNGRFSVASLKEILNPSALFSLTAESYFGNAAPPLTLMSVGYMLENSDLKKRSETFVFMCFWLLS